MNPADLDVGYLALFTGLAVNAELQRRLLSRGVTGIRQSHGFVVQQVVDGPMTIGELARGLEVTQQAASKSVTELERLGLLARTVDPNDARIRRVALTDTGHDLIATTRALRATLVDELQHEIPDQELAAARRGLLRIIESLGADEPIRRRRVPQPF